MARQRHKSVAKNVVEKRRVKKEYEQVIEGTWYDLPWRNYYNMCCDCSLVHRTNYRLKDGKLQFQTFRCGPETGGGRTRFRNIEIDRDDES